LPSDDVIRERARVLGTRQTELKAQLRMASRDPARQKVLHEEMRTVTAELSSIMLRHLKIDRMGHREYKKMSEELSRLERRRDELKFEKGELHYEQHYQREKLQLEPAIRQLKRRMAQHIKGRTQREHIEL
jgi:hypothetical protein